ncbi:hypothetical protein [Chelativorans sp.]|uniref:hypothetical protein n=1 Tax=Chelativorans sp. TaxID=2203393 RepID=UPI0028114230|nr:hypothetical protein [Chelativorans sp.]
MIGRARQPWILNTATSVAALCAPMGAAHAASFLVTNEAQLAAAISTANSNGEANTIIFTAALDTPATLNAKARRPRLAGRKVWLKSRWNQAGSD